VQDAQGAQNITASASLGESEVEGGPGITDAPNLQRSFKIDSIEFSLDENMNCGAMGASAFGYYREGGSSSVQYGSDVGDCDGNEAVIEFGAPVEDIARVFIDPTNGNEPCAPAPSGACAGFEAEGDDTEDPDLERAERDDETVTFKFDEDVTGTPDEDMFQVAAEDGTKFAPEAGSCDLAGDDEVECDFPAIEDATEGDIVLAGVGSCAITADEDSECSTIGDASIDDSGHAPGFSDGPDLETCDIDEEASTATFAFDEPVRSTSADEEGFEVFDTHGTMVDATHIGNASGSSVTVEFASGGITGAIGCHVAFDAVDDLLSNQSPESSVGVAPTTQSTTSSITTPPPPRVIPVASTVSMHYANASKRFVGSVASSRSRCRSGRKVTVKKQRSGADTSVGSTMTDGKGHFELLSRGASGRYYAVAKEKSFGLGSDHIICRKDKSPTVGAGRRG
jgi:hypothetical protein